MPLIAFCFLYVSIIFFLCGNKMPTRCNKWYLLQILLYAQHVSGTTVPIIRSSRVLYWWLLRVVFGALVFKLSVWCGAEEPSAPHHTDNLKTKAPNTIRSNHLYITLELLMMGTVVRNSQLHTIPTTWKPKHQIPQAATICIIHSSSWWWAQWCPKHVEQSIRSAIKIICWI